MTATPPQWAIHRARPLEAEGDDASRVNSWSDPMKNYKLGVRCRPYNDSPDNRTRESVRIEQGFQIPLVIDYP